MSRSIVDEIPEEPTPATTQAQEDVTLSKLADMIYLTFEAVKDLEAAFMAFKDSNE